jgi:hypothetical protein
VQLGIVPVLVDPSKPPFWMSDVHPLEVAVHRHWLGDPADMAPLEQMVRTFQMAQG